MKATVTFITPPSLFLLDERVFPALGILKVAAVAEQLGYPVEHLDLNGVSNYEDTVLTHLAHSPSNIFAITATTPQMVAVTKILKVIRHATPTAKVVLGGPHPTLVHAAFNKNKNSRTSAALEQLFHDYDVTVFGDGEDAIALALLEEAPHFIDADNPTSSLFLTSQRLEELPLPARHLIDLKSYHYTIDGLDATPLISQLGCSYGCYFCAGRDSAMLRRVRFQPIASVLHELMILHRKYGYRAWMFFDDEINLNHGQFIQLMKGMIELQDKLGVEFRARGFVKANLFTEEQAQWMHRAGFRRSLCGFESGSDRILKNINKKATKDDNTYVMELSHKYGLGMKALMSLGHPGESPETVEDTLRWLKEVHPEDFDCTIITAYPGSPYYNRAHHIHDDVWVFQVNNDNLYMRDIDYTRVEGFYKGSPDAYESYVFTDYLSEEDLVSYRNAVEKEARTYLNIPFYSAGNSVSYDASMGQLPGSVYRRSR